MEDRKKLKYRSFYVLHLFFLPFMLSILDILFLEGTNILPLFDFLLGRVVLDFGDIFLFLLLLAIAIGFLALPLTWIMIIASVVVMISESKISPLGIILWGLFAWSVLKKIISAVHTEDEALKKKSRMMAWRAARYPLLFGFGYLLLLQLIIQDLRTFQALSLPAFSSYIFAMVQLNGQLSEERAPAQGGVAEIPSGEQVREPPPFGDGAAAYGDVRKGVVQLGKHTTMSERMREGHLYVVGATRSGKSKALESWIRQDAVAGRGIGVIDPHGDLYEDVLRYCAQSEEMASRLVLIDPADPEYTVGFNPLEEVDGVPPARQALELMSVFRRIWDIGIVAARMEEILRNTLLALMEYDLTMDEIPKFLAPARERFRHTLVSGLENEKVKQYWRDRFGPLRRNTRAEWVESTLNKVNSFLIDPAVREIVAQRSSTIDFRKVMDEGKILLVNLAKGKLGEENCYLLGALMMAKIQMAAMSRVDVARGRREPFYLYVDEFQNFATQTFATILSEAAKYGLSLTMAHQNLSQLHSVPELREAVLANARNQVYFRVGREDAEVLAKEMFSVSGQQIKAKNLRIRLLGKLPWIERHKTYYSTNEEWELNVQRLMGLPQRSFWLNVKDSEEYYKDTTIQVNPIPEGVQGETEEVKKNLCQDGHLVFREKVREELAVREDVLEEIMEEKEASRATYYD